MRNFELEQLNKKAKIFNSYCLPILTVYPSNPFKRENYFPELVINMPEQYHNLIKGMNSPYMQTIYLKKEEAEKYRLFVSNGLIGSYDMLSESILPHSTGENASMVVLTEEGKLFSAKKQDENARLQDPKFPGF